MSVLSVNQCLYFKSYHLTAEEYCLELIRSVCSSRKISNKKEEEKIKKRKRKRKKDGREKKKSLEMGIRRLKNGGGKEREGVKRKQA